MAFGDTAVIVATNQGNYVTIVVSGATGMTACTVYRIQAGYPDVIVRGADAAAPTGAGLFAVGDFEVPDNVALSYKAVITDGVTSPTKGPVAVTGGNPTYQGDYLAPIGQPELGTNVNIERGGLEPLEWPVVRDVQSVLNRPSPVAVSYGRGYFRTTISFITLSDAERRMMARLIEYPVLMLVPREGYGFDSQPVYLSPGTVEEERPSPMGAETSRRWRVEAVKVDRPPPAFPYTVIGNTFTELMAVGTWTVAKNTYTNFYDMAGY